MTSVGDCIKRGGLLSQTSHSGRRRYLQLCGNDAEQRRERRLVGRENAARMAQVDQLNDQAEAVAIATVLANAGGVGPRQGRQPDQPALVLREREQLYPFRQRQQFASRHRNLSRMARLYQLK